VALDVLVERGDLRREQIEIREQQIDLPTHNRWQRDRDEPRASGAPIQIERGAAEILGGEIGVDAILEDGALAHQKGAPAQELALRARGRVRNPGGGQQMDARELGQCLNALVVLRAKQPNAAAQPPHVPPTARQQQSTLGGRS
jgi:hypothetical protein